MVTRRRFLALGGCALLAPRSFASPTPGRQTPKKGLAGAAPVRSGLRTSWYYNWGMQPSNKGIPTVDPGMRFYPMCWGLNNETQAALDTLRPEHPAVLFGFNEPDHTDQSNLTVDAALSAWPKLQDIPGELVSPACAQPHQTWMQTFMAQAERRNLRVDSIGFHHYGPPDPEDFIGLLERVHQMYGRPIWVTEFAAADWQAGKGGAKNRYTQKQVIAFMQAVCPYMESKSWVRGYAWYPWGDQINDQALIPSQFFTPDGELNIVGHAYADLGL